MFRYLFIIIGIISAQKNTQKNDKPQTKEEQELMISTNIFNSCILVSYNYLIQDDDNIINDLNKIMEVYEDIQLLEEQLKQQLIASKRIKLDACQHCLKKQTTRGAFAILEDLQKRKFDASNYYHLMEGFSLKQYYNKQINYKFDKQEEIIYEMIEQFLSKSREAQGIKEVEINDLYPQLNQNVDLKTQIFGIDIESSYFSYLIFFSVGIVLIVILSYAYNVLQDLNAKIQKNKKSQKNQKKL